MIRYVEGDATAPYPRPAVIAHICNDVGAWGAGFVVAVSRRWSEPEAVYRLAHQRNGLELGEVLLVEAEPGVHVANMVAQRGLGARHPLVQYDHLEQCMQIVAADAFRRGATIHMPRIGCGIGGGKWTEVEPILARTCERVDVYVYDLAGEVWP